ncbi:MAG: hypothetical protein J6V56_00805 [Clostridia bacterium]|nr:hypothetical protein [Clostridia bacterium]
MEVKFEIAEDKIKHFSGNAKTRITEYAKNYTLDIISEAERIELSTHEGDSPSEITSSHVSHAANKFRSISGVKKKRRGLIILKIVSELLIFITGIMFLPDQFVREGTFNIVYFIIFIVVFSAALIATIVSHFLGGE